MGRVRNVGLVRTQVVVSIIAAITLTVAVGFGASALLSQSNGSQGVSPQNMAATESQTSTTSAPSREEDTNDQLDFPDRPVCPAGPVAGVELDCLGPVATEGDAGAEGAGDNTLAAVDEGISVVNIWAWWCEPCRVELPSLDQVAEEHPEWKVVGVHADQDSQRGAALLADLDVDLPSFRDEDNLFAGTLSLPGVIPITLVLRDGEIVGRYPQPFTSAEEITAAVNSALAA